MFEGNSRQNKQNLQFDIINLAVHRILFAFHATDITQDLVNLIFVQLYSGSLLNFHSGQMLSKIMSTFLLINFVYMNGHTLPKTGAIYNYTMSCP